MLRAWSAETAALIAAIARKAASRSVFLFSRTRLAPRARKSAQRMSGRVALRARGRRGDATAEGRAAPQAARKRIAAAPEAVGRRVEGPAKGFVQWENPNAASAAATAQRRVARRLGASKEEAGHA